MWASYSRGEVDAGTLSRERFRQLLAHLGGDAEGGAALSEAYLECISRRGDLLPGCRSALARLRRRYRLGLVTNGLDRVQRARLREARLTGYFDVVVTSESCGFAKPDPRILRVALDALDVRPAEAWYVGDDIRIDGAAAQAAGVPFLWIDNGGEPPAGLAPPPARATALREVVERLATV